MLTFFNVFSYIKLINGQHNNHSITTLNLVTKLTSRCHRNSIGLYSQRDFKSILT